MQVINIEWFIIQKMFMQKKNYAVPTLCQPGSQSYRSRGKQKDRSLDKEATFYPGK